MQLFQPDEHNLPLARGMSPVHAFEALFSCKDTMSADISTVKQQQDLPPCMAHRH
jgi:hypothetical protein